MKIPFHRPFVTDEEIEAASAMLREGWLTAGAKTNEFEAAFKAFVGCEHAVAVNSATAALHLSLEAAGVSGGDEVLVPAMTFVATAEVVRYLRATPVLVDIERDTHLIDCSRIEEKITDRTKAIIPVHYAGQPCDMDAILDIAHEKGLVVIEDAAHAFPARYRGSMIGTLGDATCFSFYATKTITTGEGGMLCTNRDDWARRARMLRLHGISRDTWSRENSSSPWQYDVLENGFKYNTTDIAAAIGLAQLSKADLLLEKRRRIAERYNAAFSDLDTLTPLTIRPERETSWYLYPIRLNLEALSISRDRFIEEAGARGVSLSVHFIPLYEFTLYRELGYTPAGYENCSWVYERTVSLPIFPGMNDTEVCYVIETILELATLFKR